MSQESTHDIDNLFWLFSRLWDTPRLHLLGFPSLMDELERTIQSDPKGKQKLSFWIPGVFSELGVMLAARHKR